MNADSTTQLKASPRLSLWLFLKAEYDEMKLQVITGLIKAAQETAVNSKVRLIATIGALCVGKTF
jgi:hypothetical protein